VVDSKHRPDTFNLAELYDQARRCASGLAGRGITRGDVVAVQLPNSRECFVAHAAVWMLGSILLPIVPIYGPRDVQHLLRRSGARAFITADSVGNRRADDTLAALADLPTLAHRIVVDADPASDTVVDFGSLCMDTAGGHAPGGLHTDDECLLVYTSGTTAEPKGVRHSHRSLLAELESIEQMRSGNADLPLLSVFPSGHIAGVLSILQLFTTPAPTFVMDHWDAGVAAALIARHRVGSSAGAPIHLRQILDVADRETLDLSSLREYTTGAAGVAPALIRRADRHGVRAFRCYGSSEHPSISVSAPDDPLDRRADTDGRPTPGTDVRLIDDDGADVDQGEDGEILTRGPELFVGYDDARHTDGAFVDEWFRTGDVGRLDADGFLTITDRKKDIIVRGGEKISSREVEDVLSEHPAVVEAAAISGPDPTYGERVCAFVVLAPDARLSAADAAAHFRRVGVAPAKSPQTVIAVSELPRTPGGKVQKNRLRELLPR
jgi:acyl-CoA synthetase (AMP-forming)/AMP-acid ligase II